MSHRVLGLVPGTPQRMRHLVESKVRSVPKWLKQCAALEAPVRLPPLAGYDTEPGCSGQLDASKPIVLLGDRSRKMFVKQFGPTSDAVRLIGQGSHHLMNTFAHIVAEREALVSMHGATAAADGSADEDDTWEPASDSLDAIDGMPADEVQRIAQADLQGLRKLCAEREILPVMGDSDPEYAMATMRFNLIAGGAIDDFAAEHNLRTDYDAGNAGATDGPLDAFFAIIGASKEVDTDEQQAHEFNQDLKLSDYAELPDDEGGAEGK